MFTDWPEYVYSPASILMSAVPSSCHGRQISALENVLPSAASPALVGVLALETRLVAGTLQNNIM